MAKQVKTTGDALRYRVTLNEAIDVGGLTLRPGKAHVISDKVFEAHKDKVATHEAV